MSVVAAVSGGLPPGTMLPDLTGGGAFSRRLPMPLPPIYPLSVLAEAEAEEKEEVAEAEEEEEAEREEGGESSGNREASAVVARVLACKTLGCNLHLWHTGPCSTAVTGKRARVLTDKAREAKRGKGD